MATYVLVHGAWGGAHGFHLLRPRLRAAGHEVFTPSLTGIGERSHLTGPHVGLGLHVRDVVNTILYEDLRDIVLLGFSYGGMVVTGALDEIGDRVREIVYLDAFLPADGQSAADLAPAMAAAVPPAGEAGLGAPWLVPGRDRHYDDPAEGKWSAPRRSAQPVATFTEPVRTAVPVDERRLGRTYVRATVEDVTGGAFTAAAAHAKDSPAWRYHEIETTHMVPQNRPDELAEILLNLAG
ncbi:pimeloyl-ACP methyl ester carboxylesterase [Pseudonocardia sediminis]|uniref:Pimeloyl-ACP methyl ester carboxylesterase n=1 Tax=Pseudonocardia sediminis TaxID=1397368 RepID=A0A4Q7V5U4_PSEST|nr:alpha/beta hydrolase [Pseudonocardia sediminis]RZT88961.1 pimeloyl-ACP methyl ester carboxylesterase [Pseudonocardia sediminis]